MIANIFMSGERPTQSFGGGAEVTLVLALTQNRKNLLVDKYNNCFIKSIVSILINMLKKTQTPKKIIKTLNKLDAVLC